jgi:hypothetical protein
VPQKPELEQKLRQQRAAIDAAVQIMAEEENRLGIKYTGFAMMCSPIREA